MALALVRCSIETDQGGTLHARARVSLVSWKGRSHALLFMVLLGPPRARPMAQALRLPFEYYYYYIIGCLIIQKYNIGWLFRTSYGNILYCILRNIEVDGYLDSHRSIYDTIHRPKYTYKYMYIFISRCQAIPLMLHALNSSHTPSNRSLFNPSTPSSALSK